VAARWVVLGATFCLLVLLAGTMAGAAESRIAGKAAAPVSPLSKTPGKLTVSLATTYVIEPLRPDGYPDYLAVLERAAREGITSENNAAVGIARVLGPAVIGADDRDAFLRALGITKLPENGSDFLEYYTWVEKHAPQNDERAYEQDVRSETRPWSQQECPLVARWLAQHERPLEVAVEASKRPRHYVPRISHGDPSMGTCSFPTFHHQVYSLRYIARAFVARAMLSLHERNVQKAWDDFQTCHRLARLLAQGKSWFEGQEAMVISLMAWRGQQRLSQVSRLTPRRARELRADLERLAAIPSIHRFGLAERFEYLDLVCYTACRGTPKGLHAENEELTTRMEEVGKQISESLGLPVLEVESSLPEGSLRTEMLDAQRGTIDWDAVLKQGNEFFDRLQAAGRKRDVRERQKAVVALDQDLKALRLESAKLLNRRAGPRPREIRASQVVVTFLDAVGFGSALFRQEKLENDAAVQAELTAIALALGAYRTENARYPVSIHDLVPKYLDPLPKDPFSDGDYRYRAAWNGYLLYSVGPNGQDDGGPRPEDALEAAAWQETDDLGIRAGLRADAAEDRAPFPVGE